MKLTNLLFYREQAGLTQGDLARKVGLTRSAITNYELRTSNGATATNAKKIADALGVSLEKLTDNEREFSGVAESGSKQEPGIPFYDVDVFAGNVETFNDGPQTAVDFLRLPGIADCDFSCRVSGNSMAQRISPGAIIACKEIRDKSNVQYGSVYLLVTSETRLVKVIRKHTETSVWRLVSYNPDYDDMECAIDKVLRIFAVKMIINQEQM